MPISIKLLGQPRCQFGQRLVGSQPDANGQSHLLFNPPVQMLAPLLKLILRNTVKINETLVNRITEKGGGLLTDNADYSSRQLAIEFIVRREHLYLLVWVLLSHLVVRNSLLDA